MTTKIQVKAVVNGKERRVELERGQLNFQHLKSELTRKTQQRGQWYLRATHGSKAINNDNDLRDAVVDAEKRGDRFLSVDIVGGSAPAPAPRPAQPAAAQPARTASAPSVQPAPAYNVQAAPAASTYAPPPVAAPVQTAGVIASFYVAADPSGAEKARVAAQQEATAYVFTPAPSKYATTVEVSLASARSLLFKLTQDTPSGRVQFSQNFNMPFDVSSNDISVQGNQVVLTFPF